MIGGVKNVSGMTSVSKLYIFWEQQSKNEVSIQFLTSSLSSYISKRDMKSSPDVGNTVHTCKGIKPQVPIY